MESCNNFHESAYIIYVLEFKPDVYNQLARYEAKFLKPKASTSPLADTKPQEGDTSLLQIWLYCRHKTQCHLKFEIVSELNAPWLGAFTHVFRGFCIQLIQADRMPRSGYIFHLHLPYIALKLPFSFLSP